MTNVPKFFFFLKQHMLIVSSFLFLLGLLLVFLQTANPALSQEAVQDETSVEDPDAKDGLLETFVAGPDLATIYIYRRTKLQGAAVKKKTYLNNEFLAALGTGRYVVLRVPPGEYKIGVLPDSGKRGLTLKAEGNKVYYIRLKMKMGLVKARGKLYLVDEDEGQKAIRKMNRVKEKNLGEALLAQ